MTPADFIHTMLAGALASQAANQVPAGLSIAQAADETGWLKTTPPGNNLFGIKADAAWKGAVVMVPTHEVVHGVRVAVTCAFRAYPDFAASIVDHGVFLRANPRYAAAFSCTDSRAFARAMAAAGYATDPDYAQKIGEIIDAHQLQQYDRQTGYAP